MARRLRPSRLCPAQTTAPHSLRPLAHDQGEAHNQCSSRDGDTERGGGGARPGGQNAWNQPNQGKDETRLTRMTVRGAGHGAFRHAFGYKRGKHKDLALLGLGASGTWRFWRAVQQGCDGWIVTSHGFSDCDTTPKASRRFANPHLTCDVTAPTGRLRANAASAGLKSPGMQ